MGTISEKLTYLDETRENIRQSINSIGGNLTNSDTFRSYSDAVDEIYEKFPKVEGEGSNITLENTMEASIKSELNGDTSQEGTPTPDSPQPINVVSGGQEVVVCAKNLFDKDTLQQGGLDFGGTGVETSNSARIRSDFIEVQPNTSYVISHVDTIIDLNGIGLYKSDKSYDSSHKINNGAWNNFPYTFTTQSDTKYVRIAFRNADSTNITPDLDYKIQLELGENNQATEYEEFKEQSYEINLGKQLLNLKNGTYTATNGITATVENGEITLNGTSTAVGFVQIDLNTRYDLEKNTPYTVSANNSVANADVRIRLDNNGNLDTTLSSINASRTITYNNETLLYTKVAIRVASGITLTNYKFRPMLEKGSQATSYSPYKTPIELCKINTYKDMIFKGSGVNLLDTSEATTVKNQNGDDRTGYYCKINKTGRYYLLLNTKNTMYFGKSTDITQATTLVGSTTQTYSSFYDFNAGEYFVIWGTKTDTDLLMIALSLTALPYEPYNSKGKWLLHKEIGKVVLDGSENWTAGVYGTNSWGLNNIINTTFNSNELQVMSSVFKGVANKDRATSGNNIMYSLANKNIEIRNTTLTTQAQVQSATNGTPIYYPLATPTTTEITDSELIEQLAEFGDAKSYEGTTNINVDGDLPIILNVKALEDIFSQ